jgi:hypothetical protein
MRILRLAPLALVTAAFIQSASAETRPLTVVELFQSQGCSSCPPANANLIALSDRRDLLTLSYGVTYWDQLGWKDTFASPQYTALQWSYAHGFHRTEVFTPQIVVNGTSDTVGTDRSALEALIRREGAVRGPSLSENNGRISIAGGKGSGDVWLVRYDPRVIEVPVGAGENSGRTLPHKNVVRGLLKIGTWNGSPATYALPSPADPAWREAVLVKSGDGGPIIAAARVE